MQGNGRAGRRGKKTRYRRDVEELLRDLVIIAQYQRMSHYGLAGFGTAAAYAAALGEKNDAGKLSAIVKDIYKADEYTTQLAERAEKAAARSG